MRYRSNRALLIVRALTLALSITVGTTLWAEGPVQASGLPGGATVLDSDPGAGEQWGRVGGRDFTFLVNDPDLFSSLSWGAILSQPPSAAFDDGVDAVGETLTLSSAQSNFSGGVAVWTGIADLTLVSPSGTFAVPTRLTLTVTAGGFAVPLTTNVLSPSPGIDVLSTNGVFTANVIFEANFQNGGWEPILDMFDRLETQPGNPPGTTGPVLTSFPSAFYFELAATGLTLEEHDANITNQLNGVGGVVSQLQGIDGDLEFLKLEVPGRIANVQSKLDQVHGKVFELSGVPSTLDEVWLRVQSLPTNFPELPNDIASSEDVERVQDSLSQILLILWGLQPCPPEAGPLCETAKFVQDLASQSSVDGINDVLIGLSTELETVASQTSVDALGQALIGLATELQSVASQASVDGLGEILIGLSQELAAVASQASVDGLGDQLDTLSQRLDAVASQSSIEELAQELTAIGQQIDAVASQASVDALNEILIGLLTELGDLASQATVDAIQNDLDQIGLVLSSIQTTLDELRVPEPVVVEMQPADSSSKERRWIVKTTRNGSLVNAAITRVLAISTNKTSPAQISDLTGSATIMPLGPGLIDLTVQSGKDKGVIFQVEVSYSDGSSSAHGSSLSSDS